LLDSSESSIRRRESSGAMEQTSFEKGNWGDGE